MKIPPRNVFSSFHSQPTSSSFVNDKKPKKARIESAKTKLQDLGLTLDEVKDAFNI